MVDIQQEECAPSASTSNIAAPQDSQPTDKFTENDVKEIVALGFTRDQVVFELRRFNGDKTQATAALFAKSLTF